MLNSGKTDPLLLGALRAGTEWTNTRAGREGVQVHSGQAAEPATTGAGSREGLQVHRLSAWSSILKG